MLEEGRREAVQLLDVVAKDLDILDAVVCMRCCMWEKRAPVPGLCQAFAEKASVPRMAEWQGRLGVYLSVEMEWHSIGAFDMAMDRFVDREQRRRVWMSS